MKIALGTKQLSQNSLLLMRGAGGGLSFGLRFQLLRVSSLQEGVTHFLFQASFQPEEFFLQLGHGGGKGLQIARLACFLHFVCRLPQRFSTDIGGSSLDGVSLPLSTPDTSGTDVFLQRCHLDGDIPKKTGYEGRHQFPVARRSDQ